MPLDQNFNLTPDAVTTNATQQDAGEYVIPNNQTIMVLLKAVCRAADGTSASVEMVGCGKVDGAGNLSVVGSITTVFAVKDAAAAGYALSFTGRKDANSQARLVIRVTGDAAQHVAWFITGKIEGIGNPT